MILSGSLGRVIEDYQALQTRASKGSLSGGKRERRTILVVRKVEFIGQLSFDNSQLLIVILRLPILLVLSFYSAACRYHSAVAHGSNFQNSILPGYLRVAR